ncbi:MAG: hypothetical protein U5N56_00720 [Candidatus Marinimicrobia bacterium]|nr:hypothetical protein [Candidatus Neomarinimicrobiota bacterium]
MMNEFELHSYVNLFILKGYGSDPYTVLKLYKKLKEALIQNNIVLVVAVPNDTAYPYWKNIVKWKDIGCLEYYALPINIMNVIHKRPKLLNTFSKIFARSLLSFSKIIRSKDKDHIIKIDRIKNPIKKQRYTSEHNTITLDISFFPIELLMKIQLKPVI